jgi:hypothetical protein
MKSEFKYFEDECARGGCDIMLIEKTNSTRLYLYSDERSGEKAYIYMSLVGTPTIGYYDKMQSITYQRPRWTATHNDMNELFKEFYRNLFSFGCLNAR